MQNFVQTLFYTSFCIFFFSFPCYNVHVISAGHTKPKKGLPAGVGKKGVSFMAQVLILLAIVIYLGGMLWVGVVYSKKNKSVDDFYLGGRKLGPLVTAMSAEASDMSSWLLMGLPGVAYLTGLAEASWTAIGLIVGTYLNWLIVARRIRRYSNRLNAITVPQFFSKR